MTSGTDIVTGAFSYTGQYLTHRLLAAGKKVQTLTSHPERPHPFGKQVQAFPYHFDHPDLLAKTLQGIDTLYNTYWVRYPYGTLTYDKAVENSRTLFQAAKKAGVRRIVHVSIANPDKSSPLPYYAGKARVEEALIETGLPYGILRPTVVFGKEDILINNIAWMVRHFPVFAVPGNGTYGLQPIYVEDMADAMVQAGQESTNTIKDAVGPEQFTFNDLIQFIGQQVGKRVRLFHTSPLLTFCATTLLGRVLGDVILTREEIQGLLDNLLVSKSPALGKSPLSRWVEKNKHTLGVTYASEVKRHYER